MGNRFEDLEIWQRGYKLAVEIYKIFADSKDYGFRDQITRSALSIPSNIAEGYERDSNKEFIHFLYISKGSCGELRTQISIGIEINYISKDKGTRLIKEAAEVSCMINGLIKKRKTF